MNITKSIPEQNESQNDSKSEGIELLPQIADLNFAPSDKCQVEEQAKDNTVTATVETDRQMIASQA